MAAFLRANPAWLAQHPELYRTLAPPRRVHGEVLADHMAAMIAAERTHAAAMAERAEDVLACGRAAAGLAERVQEAVLALMRATDAAECVAVEIPGLLGLDAAALCMEADAAGLRPLPSGTVARLLEGRDVVCRSRADETATGDGRMLHAEGVYLARQEALVRVPGEGPPALLALAARDAPMLHPGQGTSALAFLGRAVAVALGR